ncbi:MAG: hypothetical protein ACR2NT_06980 [Acidimicrobiia bacterium]|nr:hypothetical protein [Acidimicrobiia bacterium]MDQ3500303.1 hypothetical protein [Actinomycetota bacterium]
MEHYDGLLRLAGDFSPPIKVDIDLTDDQELRIATPDLEIGEWPLSSLAIKALDDGFHVMSEGEELVITTSDDAGFAVAVGIRNAPVNLRKQISALMRSDPGVHAESDLSPGG